MAIHGSRMPSSLDDFSREEAGRILDFLATVHREIRHQYPRGQRRDA
jgi:hypothetical protein